MTLSAVVLNKDEPSLRECLESLRVQRVSEIIVVDGGSAPEQIDLMKEFGAKVIFEKGFGRARVKGILAARNDLIMSCDSDTWYNPNYSEVAEEILSSATAGTGPVYPKDPNAVGAKVESFWSTLPKGYVYEHNCILDRDAFIRAGLHSLPYFSYFDIGYPVGIVMDPRFDRRLWCKTRLPTRFLSVPSKIAEIWSEVFKAGLEIGKHIVSYRL